MVRAGQRAGRSGYALGAAGLAAALVRYQFADATLRPVRIAVLLIALGLAAWRLRYGILAAVFAAPLLGFIPRSVGVMDLSLPEHMVIPILLLGAVYGLWSSAPRPATLIDWPLAAFMVLVGLSAARGLWEYCALGRSLWDIVGPQLNRHFQFEIWDCANGPFLIVHHTIVAAEGALWFALLTSPHTMLRAACLRAALVLSAGVVATAGVAQSIWRVELTPFLQKQYFPLDRLYRINATLPGPNTLGSFLVLLLPLVFVAALERRRGRWLAAGLMGLFGYCLLQTASRAALGPLALTGFIGAVLASWRSRLLGVELSRGAARWLRRGVALGVVAAAVVTLAASFHVIEADRVRFPINLLLSQLNLHRPLDEILSLRLDYWHAAVRIWGDFPLMGGGIGKYVLLKNRYLPEGRTRLEIFTEAHNYYLKILSELGAVGLILFLVVLGSIGLQAWRAGVSCQGFRRRRVAAIVAGLACFLLGSFTQDPLTVREMQYVFWTVVALLVLESRDAAASDTQTGETNPGPEKPERAER